MTDLLADVQAWVQAGRAVALATVIRTWGSAPRPAGSKMAVSDRGDMSGSVSGGCVEGAVITEAIQALVDGRPRRVSYGVADETAWEIGLTCGGQIEIFVEPLLAPGLPAAKGKNLLEALQSCKADRTSWLRGVIVDGPTGTVGSSALWDSSGHGQGDIGQEWMKRLTPDAADLLKTGTAEARAYRVGATNLEVLFDPLVPPATLVIVGGVHIAMALTRLAQAVGYRVVVVDPRGAFATPERFPDTVIETSWPDEGLRRVGLSGSSAVAVLSHDPKLDDPALMVALRSPAFYVGALGSRKTQALRRSRLKAAGLTDDELGRLHGPIGIDLGRTDPEGIALAILAEIVATRAGRGPKQADNSVDDPLESHA
ncbi:MAG TPA: XdhC family protein [Anaerolineales bacterium]|nr:XdhC family protein [Anaerolineales bacterium]